MEAQEKMFAAQNAAVNIELFVFIVAFIAECGIVGVALRNIFKIIMKKKDKDKFQVGTRFKYSEFNPYVYKVAKVVKRGVVTELDQKGCFNPHRGLAEWKFIEERLHRIVFL